MYLVLLFTSCGVVRYKWGAQGAAPTGTAPAVTTLVFRDTLRPPPRPGRCSRPDHKVTVLDGLRVSGAGGASHEAGMAALWTGTDGQSAATSPSGPSIDQAIAPLLASQLGINSPYPTIPLMVRSSADYTQREAATRMLYDASANWVDPYNDPSKAQSALFPRAAAGRRPSGRQEGLIRQKVTPHLNPS